MSQAACSHTNIEDTMQFLSPAILSVLLPFSVLFSRPTWHNALTLMVGAILCRGKRTVCAVLRMVGLNHETSFAKYHHILNRVNWSPLLASKILLLDFVQFLNSSSERVILGLNKFLGRVKNTLPAKFITPQDDSLANTRPKIVQSRAP